MGTTFVGIKQNGFWVHDSLLELWLRMAALHIEDTLDKQSLAHSIRNEWLLASRGYFSGSVPLNLEENISTSEGKALVVNAFESLISELEAAPAILHEGVINLMGFDGVFLEGIESYRLISIGESLMQLINGVKFAGPEDSSFIPGNTSHKK